MYNIEHLHSCFGSYDYHLDWYMSHTNTVILAQWQADALTYLSTVPSAQRKPLLMDEFNSASCGGIPQSNMFAVALWTADYALQMASAGYSAAYLHTREQGVKYNLFDPPAGPAAVPGGAWTTNPNFYAMLAVNEALQSPGTGGSRVVDLDVGNSTKDYAAVQAGYAVYDGASSHVSSIVLFNYANMSMQSTDFVLPAALFASSSGEQLAVRYLAAPSATETTEVSWGNVTYAGVKDGVAVTAPETLNQGWTSDRMVSCSGSEGCTVPVPGPGMAVVFVGGAPSNTTTNKPPGPSSGEGESQSGAGRLGGASLWWAGVGLLCVLAL